MVEIFPIGNELVEKYIKEAMKDSMLSSNDNTLLLKTERLQQSIRRFLPPTFPTAITNHIPQSETKEGSLNFTTSDDDPFIKYSKIFDVANGEDVKEDSKFHHLIDCVFKEFYLAFCTKDKRYTKEVTIISRNVKPLITAIGGYLAAKVSIAVTVASAITAASLWLILLIGRNSLCRFWGERFETESK